MIWTIAIVGILLMALFVAVAVIGNRAQTRLAERERSRDRESDRPA